MNMITLPKNKYLQILNTQEKLREDLLDLQKVVLQLAQDEISQEYYKRLSKIEKGLSFGRGIFLKNKNEVKDFFKFL